MYKASWPEHTAWTQVSANARVFSYEVTTSQPFHAVSRDEWRDLQEFWILEQSDAQSLRTAAEPLWSVCKKHSPLLTDDEICFAMA